jgi:hypothetical protein
VVNRCLTKKLKIFEMKSKNKEKGKKKKKKKKAYSWCVRARLQKNRRKK